MNCHELKEHWRGEFDFISKRRVGKGILFEKGKEYFVDYNLKGEIFSKKRTFEGIRLMIIGNRHFF